MARAAANLCESRRDAGKAGNCVRACRAQAPRRPRGGSIVFEFVVAAGSPAEGSTVAALGLGDSGWVSLIRRDGRLVQVRGSTLLDAGDVVLALGSDDADVGRVFRNAARS